MFHNALLFPDDSYKSPVAFEIYNKSLYSLPSYLTKGILSTKAKRSLTIPQELYQSFPLDR